MADLSSQGQRSVERAIESWRRTGMRASSREIAADLIVRLRSAGLTIIESPPDFAALAAVLVGAGYQVIPPTLSAQVVP